MDISAKKLVKDSYSEYANYIGSSRVLPGIDGLIDVNRQILYTMTQLGLTSKSNYKKNALVSGAVMRFHAHGNTSIDGSIVNMVKSIN